VTTQQCSICNQLTDTAILEPRNKVKVAGLIEDTLGRMAQKFDEQLLEPKASNEDLAKYCGLYRNRPVEAIRDFPRWLEGGDEMFAYSIAAVAKEEEIKVNEPRSFDESLLEVRPENMFQAVTLDEIDVTPVEEIKQSVFNPMYWFSGNSSTYKQKSKPPHNNTKSSDIEDGFSSASFNVEDVEWN
jgi:hypothetical protein